MLRDEFVALFATSPRPPQDHLVATDRYCHGDVE
jgi:hypothetical protein